MSVRLSTVFESRRGLLFLPIAAGCLYVLGQSKHPETPEVNVKEVLLEEAKALIAAGALIVDVRERVAYETRHIAGAISAPLSLLSTRIPAALEVARANPVIVYCGDGSTLGPRGTQLLNQAGFAAAVNLKPGIQGWATAGLPLEHGAGKQA
jgi:rhodanese-related sulfurtransferase